MAAKDHLTADEERVLIQRWRRGDAGALERLVRSQLGMIHRFVQKYRGLGDYQDLLQEGMVGFLEGLHRFDPQRGLRLVTYAQWWVRARIHEHAANHGRQVSASPRWAQLSRLLNEKKLDADGNEVAPTITGRVPGEDTIEALRSYGAMAEVSIDDRRPGRSPMQIASTDDAPDAGLVSEATSDVVKMAMAVLKPREQFVIGERYLNDEARTLQSIGDELGITREAVRLIEKRALQKLRAELAA